MTTTVKVVKSSKSTAYCLQPIPHSFQLALDELLDASLIEKEKKIFEIQEAIKLLPEKGEERREIEKRLAVHLADLHEKAEELQYQKKWIEFGNPLATLTSHPDCVYFMMQSGFGYNLEMYKNSALQTSERHKIVHLPNQEPQILFEGSYTSWSKIKAEIYYDVRLGKVVSKKSPTLFYNYISPEGIVAKDRNAKELYPIEKLSKDEFKRLHAFASQFPVNEQGEVVMQLVTNAERSIERSWLSTNYLDANQQHSAMRLIDPDGSVYSFSVELDNGFMEFHNQNPRLRFSTGRGRLTQPDWEEGRKFEETQVTSWTISTAKFEEIKKQVSAMQSGEGMPFCFANKNCSSFASYVCALGGVVINTKTSLSRLLWSILPTFEKIRRFIRPIFSLLARAEAVNPLASALFYLPRKVATLATNSLFWLFGSSTVEPNAPKKREYAPLFYSWWDLFDDEHASLHHSQPIVEWQRRQNTTIVYRDQTKILFKLTL